MKLEIKPSKDDSGRPCYRIFVDGQPTSGFGYSAEKAQALLDSYLKTLGQPARTATVSQDTKRSRTSASSARSKRPFTGVMLAKKMEDVITDPRGYWMSEKLEGIRAYWTGDELYTRTGKVIAAPDWFKNSLPQGFSLDGELFLVRGEEGFEQLLSIVNKATPRDPRWKKVKYMVFDAPEISGGCERRFEALRRAVKDACRSSSDCPLVYVDQIECKSKKHLEQIAAEIEALRGEGVMLRKPGSPYSQTRSSHLLKFKRFEDAEAEIIGYERGKTSGAELGAYRAQLLDTGVEFKFDARHLGGRRSAKKLPIGTVVTVRFQRKSSTGVPYAPRLLAVRDYE